MKKIKTILILTALLINALVSATPCVPYRFDFSPSIKRPSAIPGVLTVSWSYLDKCSYDSTRIENRRFLVTITNIFDDILYSETINGNIFTFNTNKIARDETSLIFSINEVGSKSDVPQMLIKLLPTKGLQLSSKIDSLNYCLLNGYFFNASAMLSALKRFDLISKISVEYQKIFPRYYDDDRNFFNFYYDEKSESLVKMPFVEDVSAFVKNINKLLLNEPGQMQSFSVYARISADNRIVSYDVVPEKYQDAFAKNANLLKFINGNNFETDVFLNMDASGGKYVVFNKRALQDPASPDYKTFAIRGAVH